MRGLVFVLAVAACGGNSSGGDKLSALPDTKTMGELTDAEKKQLCEDFKAYQKKVKPTDDEMLRMTCQAKAAMSTMASDAKDDAALRGACTQAFDACVAKKETMPEPELDCSSPEFLGKMSECKQLTIAEITGCVKDMAGVMKKLAAENLCAGMTVADKTAPMKIFDKMKSDKCTALEDKCKAANQVGAKPAAQVEKEAIAALTDFRSRMCACKDKACAEPIRLEMNAWGDKMAKESSEFQPSEAVAKQVTQLVTDYSNCMLVIANNDKSPSPIGSGSARAGSGSAN